MGEPDRVKVLIQCNLFVSIDFEKQTNLLFSDMSGIEYHINGEDYISGEEHLAKVEEEQVSHIKLNEDHAYHAPTGMEIYEL